MQPLYEEDVAASDPDRIAQTQEVECYVETLLNDRSPLDAVFKPDYHSVTTYVNSTRPLRRVLRLSLGYPPPGQPGADPDEFLEVGEDSTARYYRTRFSALPGVHACGLYIVPKSVSRRAPLAIAMHGGGGSPELATFHGGSNYHDMVRGAVDRGYVVWAPQNVVALEGVPSDIRARIDSRARLAGTTLAAIEIAKITRGLTAILNRSEVNRRRIAMIGLSYGGFYTLYTAALEPRIRVAVSSCWFNDRADLLLGAEPAGWGDVRFPGGLSLFRDPEIVALICPRPLQIQVGDRDELFDVAGARRAAPLAAGYYQRLGLESAFEYHQFSGAHEFYGPAAWSFLERFL